MQQPVSVLILGIGNLLWADEGFGVRVVEALGRLHDFPGNVTLMDGGTQGVYLVQHIRAAEVLVVFDAVDDGLPPGTLKTVAGEDVPKFLGAKKMSLHQTGFQEVLAMAEMLGQCPRELLLIGVQPVRLDDYGGSLSPRVKAQIEPAIDAALQYLKTFGIAAAARRDALSEQQDSRVPALEIDRYEAERPSPQHACRVGDARVVRSGAFDVRPRPAPVDEGAISVDVDHRGKY